MGMLTNMAGNMRGSEWPLRATCGGHYGTGFGQERSFDNTSQIRDNRGAFTKLVVAVLNVPVRRFLNIAWWRMRDYLAQ